MNRVYVSYPYVEQLWDVVDRHAWYAKGSHVRPNFADTPIGQMFYKNSPSIQVATRLVASLQRATMDLQGSYTEEALTPCPMGVLRGMLWAGWKFAREYGTVENNVTKTFAYQLVFNEIHISDNDNAFTNHWIRSELQDVRVAIYKNRYVSFTNIENYFNYCALFYGMACNVGGSYVWDWWYNLNYVWDSRVLERRNVAQKYYTCVPEHSPIHV